MLDLTTIEVRENDGRQRMPQNSGIIQTEIINTRLDILEKICNNVRSIRQQLPVIISINEMVRYALNASASSMFLIDGEKSEIYQFIDGPLGKEFVPSKISEKIGIVRWILQREKSLLINDVNEREYFTKFKNEVSGLVTRSVICAPLYTRRNY